MFLFKMNMPLLPNDYSIPPTLYAVLNSIVNYNKDDKTKIKDLANSGRNYLFDFDYPINPEIKKDFECMVINHFMMRRIGYETVTAFKLALNVKLNEIMPMYNKLFSAIKDWEIFVDGEVTIREQTSSNTSNNTMNNITNTSNISDRRFSDTPQSAISDVQDGTYVSSYNYDNDSSNSNINTVGNSNDNGSISETITRTPADKMNNYIQFIKEKQNIYTMIFKDLDVLFYQII